MTKQKLLLLDGNSLAYRAFFALPLLTNDNGIHTNATYGFTTMLQKIIGKNGVEKVVELELTAAEKEAFDKSAEAVNKTNSVLKEMGLVK